MKQSFRFAALLLAAVAVLFSGCKEKDAPDGSNGGVVKLRQLYIVNGGISGTERYTGVVDESALTVLFENVAAETELTAVQFEATASIGAELVASKINFLEGDVAADATELKHEIVLRNPEHEVDVKFMVTIRLKAPEQAPVLDKLVVKDADGAELTRDITNIVDGVLLLGVETATAEVVSVSVKPARASYTFTTATDGVLNKANPGKLVLSFMGLSTEYDLSFSASPAIGADFSKAKVHAWNTNTSVYLDLMDENTRGADMDENYLLLVNRVGTDVANPYLLRVDDLLNDNVSGKVQLSVPDNVVNGGTHIVSAGRLAQGHIYICNLATAVGEDMPLRVYHWASPESQPELVLEWKGECADLETNYAARLGDNISMEIDASGNGYAFFSQQEASGWVFRFTVKNFTEFSNPKKIQLPGVANYYGNYHKVAENEYIFKASQFATMWLLDADGNMLSELIWDTGKDGAQATDVRVVEFNRARYMFGTNSRRFAWYVPEALCVWDFTAGMNMAEAIKIFKDNKPIDPESEDMEDPDYLPYEPAYKYVFDSGTISSACVAMCSVVEKNGSLVVFTAAPHAGMAVIEIPAAE